MIRAMALMLLVIVVAGCDYFKKPGGASESAGSLWFDRIRVGQNGAVGSSVSSEDGISVWVENPNNVDLADHVDKVVLEIQPPVNGVSNYTVNQYFPESRNGVIRVGESTGLSENTRYTVKVYAEEDGIRHSFAIWTFATKKKDRAVASVDVGMAHACAILEDASLNCWGSNHFGELGIGRPSEFEVEPVQVVSPSSWIKVSVNASYGCGIALDKSLWCWGRNLVGRLGTEGIESSRVPASVSPGREWLTVDAGVTHVCAIDTLSKLWCWGGNSEGQLGLGNTNDVSVPTQVGVDNWKAVVAGVAHTCGIRDDDSLWCWGGNAGGQLGDGSTRQSLVPLDVSFGGIWTKVGVGNQTTCALSFNSELLCWGKGQFGPLSPTRFRSDFWDGSTTGELQISNDEEVCLSSAIACFGIFVNRNNANFRPELFSTSAEFSSAELVYSSSSTGVFYNFPVKDWNLYGTNHCVSSFTSGLWCSDFPSGFVVKNTSLEGQWGKVVTGLGHVCGLKLDGSLWCWGGNDYGQLGSGDVGGYFAEPIQIGLDQDWVDIFLSSETTCALKSNGGLFCWGNNVFGQLGLGKVGIESSPVAVGAGQTWTDVSLMENKLCAINDSGELWCSGTLWPGQDFLSSEQVITEIFSFAWVQPGRVSMPYHIFEHNNVAPNDYVRIYISGWGYDQNPNTFFTTSELVKVNTGGKILAFTQPFELLKGQSADSSAIGRELAHEVCFVLENGSAKCISYDPRQSVSSSCYHDETKKLHCASFSGEEIEPGVISGTYGSGMNICNKSSQTDLPYCYTQKDSGIGEWVSASVSQFYACGIAADKQLSCEGQPLTGYAKKIHSRSEPWNNSNADLYSVRF